MLDCFFKIWFILIETSKAIYALLNSQDSVNPTEYEIYMTVSFAESITPFLVRTLCHIENGAQQSIWAVSKDQLACLLSWKQSFSSGISSSNAPDPNLSCKLLEFEVSLPMAHFFMKSINHWKEHLCNRAAL